MEWPASCPGHLTPEENTLVSMEKKAMVAKNKSGSLSKMENPLPCRKSAFTP
jgi:hypothetical protein